jgi:hypothetical protein
VLCRRLARPLRVEAPLAYGAAAVAAVVAEIAVAGAARHQVVTIVALVAQVAIRTVIHRQLSTSCDADASATVRSRREVGADAGGRRLDALVRCGPVRALSFGKEVRIDLFDFVDAYRGHTHIMVHHEPC